MHLVKVLALAASVILPSIPCSLRAEAAPLNVIGQSGGWIAVAGASENGTPMCAMANISNNRGVTIKWFKGADYLILHLYKAGWDIPSNPRARIVLMLDASPWDTVAHQGPPHTLEIRIGNRSIPDFTHDFTSSSRFSIQFKTGDEAPWDGSLQGSSTVMKKLVECITKTAGPDGVNPYSSGAPPLLPPRGSVQTQPFSAPDGRLNPPLPGPRPRSLPSEGAESF